MINCKYTIKDAIDLSFKANIIAFWKPYGQGIGKHCFCQWYKSNFEENNIIFSCAEQYMMYKKAILFNDIDIANKILKESKPDIIRKLGREITNFNDTIWNEHKFDIVYTGNLLKFSQNKKLKEYLLSTKNALIVEASPYDAIWGVKLSENNENINYPERWRGQNLLGFAIMQVRDSLKENN